MKCAICFESLGSSVDAHGDGKHLFHLECLKELYSANKQLNCPLCRNPFSLDIVKAILSSPDALADYACSVGSAELFDAVVSMGYDKVFYNKRVINKAASTGNVEFFQPFVGCPYA